jgi:flagellar protein FlaF
MSIQAYQKATRQLETPRDGEYRAFGLATAGLLRAKEAGAGKLGELAEALDKNRRLWSFLAMDCAHPDNRLDQTLRAQIISISLFVDRHTSDVLRTGAELDALIDINRAMMEGLRGQGASAGL